MLYLHHRPEIMNKGAKFQSTDGMLLDVQKWDKTNWSTAWYKLIMRKLDRMIRSTWIHFWIHRWGTSLLSLKYQYFLILNTIRLPPSAPTEKGLYGPFSVGTNKVIHELPTASIRIRRGFESGCLMKSDTRKTAVKDRRPHSGAARRPWLDGGTLPLSAPQTPPGSGTWGIFAGISALSDCQDSPDITFYCSSRSGLWKNWSEPEKRPACDFWWFVGLCVYFPYICRLSIIRREPYHNYRFPGRNYQKDSDLIKRQIQEDNHGIIIGFED